MSDFAPTMPTYEERLRALLRERHKSSKNIALLIELEASVYEGYEVYGPDKDDDPRSMIREAIMEVRDSLFYLGRKLIEIDEMEQEAGK